MGSRMEMIDIEYLQIDGSRKLVKKLREGGAKICGETQTVFNSASCQVRAAAALTH